MKKPAPVSKPSAKASNGFDWLEQVELDAMDRSRHGRPLGDHTKPYPLGGNPTAQQEDREDRDQPWAKVATLTPSEIQETRDVKKPAAPLPRYDDR